MSSENSWQLMTLQDAGISLIDCDHKTPTAQTAGFPYIAIPQLKDGHVRVDGTERRISETDFMQWTKKLLPQENDVIVVRRCNSGQSAYVPKGVKWAIGQNLVVLRSDGKKVYPPFLRWLVRSDEWWEQVRKYLNVGAVFDSLKCREIPLFELPIPPMVAQIEIATVLNSIDARIELLRETNTTLEAIAQALFKSWFVDFDPVHANAGTQAPSLPPEIQALFPATFIDSPQGPIPEGWALGTIADAVATVGGATPDTKNGEFWNPAEVAWTSPKDLSGLNTPVLLDTERKVSEKGLAKISSGLLPAGTLLMSSRAPIGYLAIAQLPLAINQGYIAIPPGGRLPPLYMLFWCRQNMEIIKNRANGSTFMEISKKAFRPIELVLPPVEVIEAFVNVAQPLFDRLVENEKQAQTLATLRDTLLPRLISGQLRLPEAKAVLADID